MRDSRLDSIKEKSKKTTAIRNSGAQLAGLLGPNHDIQSEISSASTVTEGMELRDDQSIEGKKGLTYRDAAMQIMYSLNEVSRKLGMNPLVEPVVENATKAVQQELIKQYGSTRGKMVDNYVIEYTKMMINKIKGSNGAVNIECPGLDYQTTDYAKIK